MKRVHIHNSADEADALRLTAAGLKASIAKRPQLAGQLEVSESSGSTAGGLIPADTEILFTGAKLKLTAVLQEAPALRWVQTTFAGVESVVPTLPPGLLLTNASGVHAEKGGEFLLAAALMLAYRIPQFVADQAQERWRQVFVPTLKRSRITILGVGAIGRGAAERFRLHGCRVTGITRSGKAEAVLDRVADLSDLDAILAETDVLVSTLPHTPETRGLIDRRRVDLLPEGAGIVVVGRAAVLDYDAIMDRLDAGSLSGAVLEVFPKEPIPPGDRIWHTPRLIVSPHCSVDDHTTYLKECLELFLGNVEHYLAGRPLANLVDPSLGY